MKSIEQLINKKDFYHVNKNLTTANFPIPEKIQTEGWRLIKIDNPMSSEEVLEKIKSEGCRPANVYELALWAEKNKEEQMPKGKWSAVIAFGQLWEDADGDRGVPLVRRYSGGDFEFGLGLFGRDWDGGGCLLVFAENSTKKIKLFSGEEAIVDSEDYENTSKYKWHISSHGYAVRYIVKNGKKSSIAMHQDINNTPSGYQTDHINRNRLDNRKENLRTVTWSENQLNTGLRIDNSSGEKGISKKGKKWQVHLRRNKKRYFLGNFETLKEAVKVRDSFGDDSPKTLSTSETSDTLALSTFVSHAPKVKLEYCYCEGCVNYWKEWSKNKK